MKICFIAPGLTWHVTPWVKGMQERGHETLVIDTTISSDTARNGSAMTVRLPGAARNQGLFSGLVSFPMYIFGLRSLLAQFKPDILHIMSATPHHMFGVLTGFHPVILTAYGAEVIELPKHNFRNQVTIRTLGKFVDAVTADSQHVLDEFSRLTKTKAWTQRVYWGVDLKNFRPDLNSTELRARLNLHDGPVILSPRRLDWYYNHDIILDCIPQVLERYPKAQFVFKHGDGDATPLIKQAQSLGVSSSVRFVGYVPEDEMPLYYAMATIAVTVPSSDSTPRAVFEAMACGALPIVSDLPWVRETELIDDKNCRVVPVRNAAKLAEAILDFLECDRLDEIREANSNYVSREVSANGQLDQMEALYKRLLAERRK